MSTVLGRGRGGEGEGEGEGERGEREDTCMIETTQLKVLFYVFGRRALLAL